MNLSSWRVCDFWILERIRLNAKTKNSFPIRPAVLIILELWKDFYNENDHGSLIGSHAQNR